MSKTLSEAASKALLAAHGVPVVEERLVSNAADAVRVAEELGWPVAAKLCGAGIAHKTERGLVRLGLVDAEAVRNAALVLLDHAIDADGEVGILVAPMVRGNRELIAGLSRDPQFGMTVMIGVGGILAEAVGDVSFRLVPITRIDAEDMIDELETQALLRAFRGEPAVDRERLVNVLVGLSAAAEAHPELVSADVNPLIVADGVPLAVDALVEVEGVSPTAAQFSKLFDPRGIVVAGASSHPGKFGFVALHNILACGYLGRVFATNLEGTPVLGVETVADIHDIPAGAADLVLVCTPASANPGLFRASAAKGVGAAFVTSAGYGEAGEAGRAAQDELVRLADELGLLLAGPNGQGLVSTPSSLCAQIVAPYPPPGRIGIASQSGNFVSSFMNYARHYGVGISRAVSAGNAAAVGVADYLDYYADDPETAVGLAYVEGITDGRMFIDRLRTVAERMPLVVVKGGASEGGARAAASHTGSLATDDRIFDGACRQAGVVRAATIEEAYEAAATFATQPLPRGPNVCVVSTAGGWGVVSADAISRTCQLRLLPLPDDLRERLDAELPPRWSRNNPVDLAGGETRDTVPTVLEIVARHPAVDAVLFLGMGIQDNQGRLEREGPFYPDHGLERIVGYHARQDRRFTQVASQLADEIGKPILTATELAIADPTNAAVQGVRASDKLCYASANRAVTALSHLWTYARWRDRRGLRE